MPFRDQMVATSCQPYLRRIFFKLLLVLFGVVFCLSADFSPAGASEEYSCNGELYKDSSLSSPRNFFSASDKVYLKIVCNQLPAGSYTIVTDWINPLGKLAQQNTYDFEIKKATTYMSYSWMKLLRNGPLQRNLTGRDVDLDHYGEWIVEAYLRGKEVVKMGFTVH